MRFTNVLIKATWLMAMTVRGFGTLSNWTAMRTARRGAVMGQTYALVPRWLAGLDEVG
jgi:hypothetical protein